MPQRTGQRVHALRTDTNLCEVELAKRIVGDEAIRYGGNTAVSQRVAGEP